MSTEAQPTNPAPVVENDAKNVEDPCKVFAGNLSFSTTEDEIKEMFSVAGNVTDVSLITRGTRSLGYGFVTFSTEEEAKKAAETLNKKEIGGREINVESAKPQGAISAANGLKKKSNNKKKAGARARRPRNEQGEEGGETAGESAAEGAEGAEGAAASGQTKSAKRRSNKKKAAAKKAGESDATPAEGETAASEKPKPKKRQPKPKGPPTGEPSKTTLFVSNLSWGLDDEKLKAIFSQYQVKSATVVRNRFNNRSKGFGFVEFENEEEQQKALANEHGKSHEEREIHLKVAVVNQKKDEENMPAEETAANPAVETPQAA